MRNLSLAFTVLLMFSSCVSPSGGRETSGKLGENTPPRVVHRVEPEYPVELRRQGATGIVTIEGLVDTTGRFVRPRILRSSDPRLNEFALAAIRQWRFMPSTVNGEPTEVLFQVEVSFSTR